MLVQFFVRLYDYEYKNKYILYKPGSWNVANHLSKSLFVTFFNDASLTFSVSKSIWNFIWYLNLWTVLQFQIFRFNKFSLNLRSRGIYQIPFRFSCCTGSHFVDNHFSQIVTWDLGMIYKHSLRKLPSKCMKGNTFWWILPKEDMIWIYSLKVSLKVY